MSDVNYVFNIRDFLMSLNQNQSYFIFVKYLININSQSAWRSGVEQMFIPVKFNLDVELKKLIHNIYKQHEKLCDQYDVNSDGVININYRPYYSKSVYDYLKKNKIINKNFDGEILNNLDDVDEVDIAKIFNFNEMKSKIKLDLQYRKLGDIKDVYISDKYMPFSIREENYGLFYKYIKEEEAEVYRYNSFITIKRIYAYPSYHHIVYQDNVELFSYEDIVQPDGSWIRKKDRLRLYFDNHDKYLGAEGYLKCGFIPPISTEPELANCEKERNDQLKKNFNVLTLDFEAYKIEMNGQIYFTPYAAALYDGNNTFVYHINEYDSIDDLLTELFNQISKYNNYTVYVHNLGGFDIAFIFKYLYTNHRVKIISKDNRTMAMYITNKVNKNQASYKVKRAERVKYKIFDSLLILTQSLDKISKSFKMEIGKTYFPHDFINKETLNYIGAIPDQKYWGDIPTDIYEELKKNFSQNNWSCLNELMKYINNDVVLLYNVIFKMYSLIRTEYNIDMINSISMPNLSFKIFRTKKFFSKANDKIPIVRGLIANDIRSAYFGGFNEVYNTSVKSGFYYDVNSLYPYCMTLPMPTGAPKYTTEKNLFKIFGFVYAKIEAPVNIKKPILPHKTDNGKIITPLGNWSGWYFSEELKNAVKFGYKVEVIKAYVFTPDETIFKDFVDHFYNKKLDKNNPLNPISKLILNSLSGRFAMNENLPNTIIIDEQEFDYYVAYYTITDYKELDSNKIMITYIDSPNLDVVKNSGAPIEHYYQLLTDRDNIVNTSIPISAAITSYGRIFMSEYIMNPEYDIAYIDTDGMLIQKPLPESLVNNNIGCFKLEYKVLFALIVAPKSYIIITDDNKRICKFKGVTNKLSLFDYVSLYNGESIIKTNEKWFIHNNTYIEIKDIKLVLNRIIDKRVCIITNNRIVETGPIILNNGKITTRDICKYIPAPITIYNYKKSPKELIIYKNTD